MRIAISDASILVDFANVGLLNALRRLPCQLLIPDLVRAEITPPDQKEAVDDLIDSNTLTVSTATAQEIEQMANLRGQEKGLSIADCSVLILSQAKQALVARAVPRE